MSDKAQDVGERCSDFVQCTEEIEVERRKGGGVEAYTFLRNSEKQTGSKLCYMAKALWTAAGSFEEDEDIALSR